MLNIIMARHTKRSIEQIVQDSDRDFYLSAIEAKEYGIVDEVVTSLKEKELTSSEK